MRYLSLLLALALVFTTGLQSGCAGCKDEPQDDDDVTEDDDSAADDDDDTTEVDQTFRGLWASMEVTSAGEVLIAFYDVDEGGLGLARSGDGGASFSYEQVDGYTYTTDAGLPVNPGDRGMYVDMALDSGDTPHLAYHDRDEMALMYATRDGEEWATAVVDAGSGSAEAGTFNSIALDGSGNPAIAYYDIKEKALKFASKDGSWADEIVDEGELLADGLELELDEPDVGQYAHLLYQDGTWWIAYYDVANGNLKLAHGTPGAWTLETLMGDGTGDVGAWPYLHPTATPGVFRIALHDVTNQDLVLGRYEAGVLNTTVIDDGAYVGADSVIADVGGATRIHYFDGYNNDVKQAIDNGDGSWSLSTLVSDGAVGYSNNLQFHGGQMHVCSFNYTTGDFHFEKIAP